MPERTLKQLSIPTGFAMNYYFYLQMQYKACRILTIAPYRFLPAKSGGHAAILHLHEHIGRLCDNYVVSTVDNDNTVPHSFKLHRLFPNSPKRYIPYNYVDEMLRIGKENNITHIICEHPYMAFSAIALAKKLKIPWYLRCHNIEAGRFRTLGKKWWPLLRMYERYAMRRANGVLFLTNEDAARAVEHYRLEQSKCHFLPYGTVLDKQPDGNTEAKQLLAKQLSLDHSVPWLYFIGALGYYPNQQAVELILDEVLPRLNQTNTAFQLIIAGQGLNESLQQRIQQTPNSVYTGFISELHPFINACDIMLNPVLLGGGVKTKAVEALGYNKTVISCKSGSAGLLPAVSGANLYVSEDEDWQLFTADILKAIQNPSSIPASFYETYYWGNIAKKALDILNG